MDAPRITPEEIVEMQRLYAILGTYAAVAREMGRSASSVSKYVQMKDIPRNIRIAVENLSQKVEEYIMKRLLEDKRNIWYLCGMLAGVAAIIIGIWFLDRQFYDVTELDKITFGGDFYTEIYNASRRIHALLGHINDFIEYVKTGFGFTFILGGVVDICVFGSKLNIAKKEELIEEISTCESNDE